MFQERGATITERIVLNYHTVLTPCSQSFRSTTCADIVAAVTDNKIVVDEDRDVDRTERSLWCSAASVAAEGHHPVTLNGAVNCDVAESSGLIGVWHPDDRSGDWICTHADKILLWITWSKKASSQIPKVLYILPNPNPSNKSIQYMNLFNCTE